MENNIKYKIVKKTGGEPKKIDLELVLNGENWVESGGSFLTLLKDFKIICTPIGDVFEITTINYISKEAHNTNENGRDFIDIFEEKRKNNKLVCLPKENIILVTVEHLNQFGWKNSTQNLADQINEAFTMFKINTGNYAKEQIITLMATAAHESGLGISNYIQMGSKGQPYCGAGAIQLTGKDNYKDFDKYLLENKKGYNGEIMKTPIPSDIVASKYAWIAAAWYWNKNFRHPQKKINDYLCRGYKLYDINIYIVATVQGLRADNSSDYEKIVQGKYKILYSTFIKNGKYKNQNLYDVYKIQVDGGGIVYTSNNWDDRIKKFEKSKKIFGGNP